ncbi:MAG: sodium transporter, partial [Deltaproteobacteria bacterium]|nr:sodium transporter [Deltaproteobacteria bacterium]
MSLGPTGLLIVVGWLVLALIVGLWASRRAGASADAYFVADRSLPGWMVGISIVATTFAADTPLAISAMVATKGVAANWFWWSMGIAHVGMFLFWARLWRGAAVVTDAELAELRYGAGAGGALRSMKAVFFSLVYNAIVLGWVIRAMQKIAAPFARWEDWLPEGMHASMVRVWPADTPLGGVDEALTIFLLVALAAGYSALGGLRGVVVTDLVQFCLALVGSFALAWVALDAVGGPTGLVTGLKDVLGEAGAAEVLAFHPVGVELGYLPLQAFAVYLFMRWWAHPMGDGGGYIAQRLLAARDPGEARVAAGVFVVLHYVVRPWPWVLVGLAGLVLFPPGAETSLHSVGALVAADREMAYPVAAGLLLPPWLLGLLVASLLAAFMSTVDTHLNWGVSYVAHDLWARRVRPGCSSREEVIVGRVATVVFALAAIAVTTQIGSVEKAWKFVAALGSGMGLPVLLRWLWWRINAQAEMAGALGSFTVAIVAAFWFPDARWESVLGVAIGTGATASMICVAAFGPPPMEALITFHERVNPPGV